MGIGTAASAARSRCPAAADSASVAKPPPAENPAGFAERKEASPSPGRVLGELARRRPVAGVELPESVDLRSPEREASEAELFRQLDAALDALPFEQRSAFVLSQLQGLSYEEVGRIEGVGVGTVKSRIARAREKLRCLLRHVAEPHS